MKPTQHQYIERDSGRVCPELPFADRAIRILYSEIREYAPGMFRALTGKWTSALLGFVNFDSLASRLLFKEVLERSGDSAADLVRPGHELDTPRKIFQRQIRYWDCRPMPEDPRSVVSPADSRVICGSLDELSSLFIKGKFFDTTELLGADKPQWVQRFEQGAFAIFRLTPDKYHYNHTPVAGVVKDFYAVPGQYHSCNPSAVVCEVTPHSKNKRMVTIIDTDVYGGTGMGLVAMIEVVALMIGDILQCYSEHRYDDPRETAPGMFLRKGCPKSLFRPGSSTMVLLFEPGQIVFAEDMVRNMLRTDVSSRFSAGFGRPLVETDLRVRSLIGTAAPGPDAR